MQRFRPEQLEKTLQAFSRMERTGGSAGEAAACEYIINQLSHWGIAHHVETYPAYLSTPIKASVEIGGAVGQHFKAMPRSYSASCPQGVRGELFYDIHAKETLSIREEEAWYRGAKDHIVIGYNFYEDYVQRLCKYGIKGLIHIWTSEENILHYETVSPVWGTAQPEEIKTYPPFPVIGITHEDGEKIVPLLSPGACKTEATLTSIVEERYTQIMLPVAEIPGETKEYILVGNHYDSWDKGVTDNATGNALALELAYILSQRQPARRGIKIAWWPAHSNGRYAGSTHYCDANFAQLNEDCMALINLDSPGSQGGAEIGFSTSGVVQDFLKPFILRHSTQESVIIKPLGRGSDLSFYGPHIPIQVSFDFYQAAPNRGRWHCAGSGGGWWWHTVADGLEHVDMEYLMRDGAVLLELVESLATALYLPFDASSCCNRILDEIADIQKECDAAFDFSQVLSAAEELKKKLAGRTCFLSGKEAKEVGGRLTQLLCSACDSYHFDNTFSVGALPGLQMVKGIYQKDMTPREFLAWQTAFRRQCNRFITECKKAAEYLQKRN